MFCVGLFLLCFSRMLWLLGQAALSLRNVNEDGPDLFMSAISGLFPTEPL
uniref:Uncharacterized protein n=1 Tax=Arundo donax TaxID=35708 RepID=A0A0A9EQV0_ARUDO